QGIRGTSDNRQTVFIPFHRTKHLGHLPLRIRCLLSHSLYQRGPSTSLPIRPSAPSRTRPPSAGDSKGSVRFREGEAPQEGVGEQAARPAVCFFTWAAMPYYPGGKESHKPGAPATGPAVPGRGPGAGAP